MKFQITGILEKDVVSKKTGVKYNRVIVDFGDFQKIIILSTLEFKNLYALLNKNE